MARPRKAEMGSWPTAAPTSRASRRSASCARAIPSSHTRRPSRRFDGSSSSIWRGHEAAAPHIRWGNGADGGCPLGTDAHPAGQDAEREWAYDRKSQIGKLDMDLDEVRAKGRTVV